MEHLTAEQNQQLTNVINDINIAAAAENFPDVIDAGGFSSVEAHRGKLAFDAWLNAEPRPDWLVGELTRVF